VIDPINSARQVAAVGSPSTHAEVTLDLLDAANQMPLVGSMLFLTTPLEGGEEFALGTVTGVTTTNTWHANPLMRGVVKTTGRIPGMSGDAGDVRDARVRIQAVYRRHETDGAMSPWTQSGPSLRMSPPTGSPVRLVSNDVIDHLMCSEPDLHYLGTLHSSGGVRLPLSIRDFASERGAYHLGIFGMSGSGKSALSAYLFAGQMRHRDHGMIIIDPQGQWASETGLPFSLQEFAAEMGREVIVRRVSEDLRLEKDAPLFAELLGKTRFTAEITKMSPETAEYLFDEVVKILRKRKDWDTEDSGQLLSEILVGLNEDSVLGRIYSAQDRQARLAAALDELLDDADRMRDLMKQFQPLHNLFSPTNPAGGKRHSMWGTISHVFDKTARKGRPAPLLILDMSTSGQVSWVSTLLADEQDQRDMLDALRVLDQDNVKAAILRKACRTLKEASESAFREGETLNTMVVFDEAWRYAPPPREAADDEIKALSTDLAGYFRDTRKFGVGWCLISQSPRSINGDCWDQMSIRVLGYGLGGADLAKVSEQMDDPDHLKLYRAFASPESTKPRVYPFMILGPVSPLAFTKAPVFVAAYTDFDDFRRDNDHWLTEARLSLGLPVLSGTPKRAGMAGPVRAVRTPGASPIGVRVAPARPRTGSTTTRQALGMGNADVARVRAHAANGGVDAGQATGLSNDGGIGGGLGSIDDDEPIPF